MENKSNRITKRELAKVIVSLIGLCMIGLLMFEINTIPVREENVSIETYEVIDVVRDSYNYQLYYYDEKGVKTVMNMAINEVKVGSFNDLPIIVDYITYRKRRYGAITGWEYKTSEKYGYELVESE